MENNSNQHDKKKRIHELIERVENGETISQEDIVELKTYFEQVRKEISIAENTNEKPQSFSRRKTITSQIVKYAGFKIIYEQIKKVLEAIIQEL